MRPVGRPAADKQTENIEFVPKRDLDEAHQENQHLRQQIERLRRETERLKQETERLRRELEAALRASKRQAAPHSRGNPVGRPKRPGRKPGRPTADRRAVPSRCAWMNGSRFRCRNAVRIAAAAWWRKAAKHSIRKRLSGEP